MMSSFFGLLFGVVLGARHALEPDHLVAVSVLAADRPDMRRGAWLGAVWGLGHLLALVCVGLVLVALSTHMPARWADGFELLVAFMLMALGGRAIYRAARDGKNGPHLHHAHGAMAHEHPAAQKHVHMGRFTLTTRPLVIGLLHGLAGSGALTAFVMATLPSTATRIGFMVLFGVGSVFSMALLSGLAGLPLARLGRYPAAGRGLFAATGVLSIGYGLFWAWPLLPRLI